MRVLLALLLVVSVTVRAEDNCGTLEQVVTNVAAPLRVAEMNVVWMRCDGDFRRFLDVLPAVTRPVEVYDGWIEVGHVYRAKAVGRQLEPLLRMPRHHDGGLAWTNADALLPDDQRRRVVVFEVTGWWIQHQGEGMWMSILDGTILEVK